MKKIVLFFLASFSFLVSCDIAPLSAHIEQLPIISEFFPSQQNEVQMRILSGGFSRATNIAVELDGNSYVIRTYPADYSQKAIDREFFAMQEASHLNIAPHVYRCSRDRRSIMMAYIDGRPLLPPISQSVLDLFAKTLKKAHSIPKSPFIGSNFKHKIERMYQESIDKGADRDILEASLHIFYKELAALLLLSRPSVMVHGDLNPHNIFITESGIHYIDWSETRLDDPFFDISLFSLFQALPIDEEEWLLAAYVGRALTAEDRSTYAMVKRANLASLAISSLWLTVNMESESQIDRKALPKDWAQYIELFAMRTEKITSQIFYELSKAALVYAQSL